MNKIINISNRLKTIGDFVIDNSKIIDVGCDHGLLSIYIAQKYKNVKIIASDINNGPLNSAYLNVKKFHLEDKIETRISDGLKNINDNEFDTIIISGLGGNKIVDILKFDINKTKQAKNIIIQANNNINNVRRFLTANKYKIVDEILIKENNVISTIILFKKVNNKVKYKKIEILFGPILLKEKAPLFIELITNIFDKEKQIFNKIPNKYVIKKIKMIGYIKILKKIIKTSKIRENENNL